jgi:predicted Rossmann fold nucleotide-binding protein DprA/Smf involved in DNA uptake
MLMRSTAPLIYHGQVCLRHRCADRLVDTHECLECVGPVRLRQMEERSERQALERQMHRVLHEMSDGAKTALQLVHTTGLSMTQLRTVLEQLAASGRVAPGQDRLGQHSRRLWSLVPFDRQRSSTCR